MRTQKVKEISCKQYYQYYIESFLPHCPNCSLHQLDPSCMELDYLGPAQNPDGSLKEPHEIDWAESASDDEVILVPPPTDEQSTAFEPHPHRKANHSKYSNAIRSIAGRSSTLNPPNSKKRHHKSDDDEGQEPQTIQRPSKKKSSYHARKQVVDSSDGEEPGPSAEPATSFTSTLTGKPVLLVGDEDVDNGSASGSKRKADSVKDIEGNFERVTILFEGKHKQVWKCLVCT